VGNFPIPIEEGKHASNTHQERQLSWGSGSALVRTIAQSSWGQKSLRNDLSIGIITSAEPRTQVTWRIDGHVAKQKISSPSHGLLFLPSGCDFEDDCRGPGQGLWLFIDPQSVAEDERLRSFAKRITVDYSWSNDRLLWSVIAEIKKECLNGFPRGSMFLERAAMVFLTQLAYFLDNRPIRFEPTHALSDNRLREVIDYIESNLDRNITLSEVAGLVNLTPRYFCAAFRGAVGRSPHQFQIERRMERAKTLLSDANFSVADVAFTVGFSSQSHLSYCFRRIMGVTPARYRAEFRTKANPSDDRQSEAI
jgi:AraC family transcriptional regulator